MSNKPSNDSIKSNYNYLQLAEATVFLYTYFSEIVYILVRAPTKLHKNFFLNTYNKQLYFIFRCCLNNIYNAIRTIQAHTNINASRSRLCAAFSKIEQTWQPSRHTSEQEQHKRRTHHSIAAEP